MTTERKIRWRLVLGEASDGVLGGLPKGACQAQDNCLAFLYDREYQDSQNVHSSRSGGLSPSQLTVPEWINRVHELFPKRTIERLEKDALERYQIDEIVTNPELLARAQPSMTLLKAVLHTKHLMNQEVLAVARQMVRRVVDDLMKALARQIQSPFAGALDRRRRSNLKVAKNFDARTTIERNLRYYDTESKRLFLRTPYFSSRVRRHIDRWKIIILVDQSGSMVESVIHAAVTASIFHGMKSLRTNLVAFDTEVVDLSEECSDPVETLLKVQLGGGTDIGRAVEYASTLVDDPRRTILVLITDFYEGAPPNYLLASAKRLLESGVTFLGLAALDARAEPVYDRALAAQLVNLGAHVGAMTPGELAQWVAEKVR